MVVFLAARGGERGPPPMLPYGEVRRKRRPGAKQVEFFHVQQVSPTGTFGT